MNEIITDIECLRQKSLPATSEQGKEIGERLVKLMYKNIKRWAGVAAPQVGDLVRVVGTKLNGRVEYLVNPEIIEYVEKPKEFDNESCLSFPRRRFSVMRSRKIKVKADNVAEPFLVFGFEAICIQHEIDHLDGKVVPDYGEALELSVPVKRAVDKVGRNEPCPCGSGKKYKKCCWE